MFRATRQLTSARHGHILTNIGVWSPDSRWIVYDVRSDPAGSQFDGDRIERVDIQTGKVEVLFRSREGACCGVVTWHPHEDQIVFIHGEEHPTSQWNYAACRRRGVWLDVRRPEESWTLDARDLTFPGTRGALRGGTHVHTWSGDGRWVAFTYEDHISTTTGGVDGIEPNRRAVGIAIPGQPVIVPKTHPRNHDGSHFSVVVTDTVTGVNAAQGECIIRACSDAWVGVDGFMGRDGLKRSKAIAFLGRIDDGQGEPWDEVFVVELPEDPTVAGERPLQGSETWFPAPSRGVVQRRLTYTRDRKLKGVRGPRHWVRSSPDGSRIAFLMPDESGVIQLWTVSPEGSEPEQVTRGSDDVQSAFTWSPDGSRIAHASRGEVAVTDVERGETVRLTEFSSGMPIRPEACVFSPDGRWIAFVRPTVSAGETWNQIGVVAVS